MLLVPLPKFCYSVSVKKYLTFDAVTVVLILIYCLILWLPTRFYPYHWDAAGYIINEAVTLKANHFWPITNQNSDFSHPPLFPLLLASLWSAFGVSKLVSHLLILPFLPLLMISTFFLIKKLFNRQIATLSTFLIGTVPVVLAEYGNIYPDLPTAALIVLAFALFVYHQKYPAIIAFTLAVLFKETAVIFLPFFLIYPDLTAILKQPRRQIPWLIPVAALALWFFYHFLTVGWVYTRPGRPLMIISSLKEFYQSMTYIFWQIGFAQNRWLAGLLGLISAILLFYKRIWTYFHKPGFLALAISLIIAILFYTVIGEFASRYGLVLILLWYVLSLVLASELIRPLSAKRYAPAMLVIGIALIMGNILTWHPSKQPQNTYDFRPPDDLSYIDMIDVFRQLGLYSAIENNNPHWYGAFPENLYLTQNYLEYVKTPALFSMCNQFALNRDIRQLIIFHPYSPGQVDCENLLQTVSVKPYKQLTKGDKWIEIYEVTATASAAP